MIHQMIIPGGHMRWSFVRRQTVYFQRRIRIVTKSSFKWMFKLLKKNLSKPSCFRVENELLHSVFESWIQLDDPQSVLVTDRPVEPRNHFKGDILCLFWTSYNRTIVCTKHVNAVLNTKSLSHKEISIIDNFSLFQKKLSRGSTTFMQITAYRPRLSILLLGLLYMRMVWDLSGCAQFDR